MPTIGPEDERLERLRDLSDRIAAAMAEMHEFQAKVATALRQIRETRGPDSRPGESQPMRPRPRATLNRRKATRPAA